jgi:hypothetical protein
MSTLQDVVIHEDVVTEQVSGITHVLEKTANTGGKMKNMSGAILIKDGFGLRKRSTVIYNLSGDISVTSSRHLWS